MRLSGGEFRCQAKGEVDGGEGNGRGYPTAEVEWQLATTLNINQYSIAPRWLINVEHGRMTEPGFIAGEFR